MSLTPSCNVSEQTNKINLGVYMAVRLSEKDYLRLFGGNAKPEIKKESRLKCQSSLLTGETGIKKSKYRNIKCTFNNIKFDSILEMERYIVLNAMLAAGEIKELELQKVFSLVVNEVHVCDYKADFTYYDKNGIYHVEDAKGVRTREYINKKKLMKGVYGIDIEEITKIKPKSGKQHRRIAPKTTLTSR
ncbi:DUF1064 domain-containing protein [Aeromonas sp. 23P]|uniref:DUF1064 domain-containing protein n=1 Tax=Aeromonas sp. 23P TaxID=3452716 RepID=UPI003F78D692